MRNKTPSEKQSLSYYAVLYNGDCVLNTFMFFTSPNDIRTTHSWAGCNVPNGVRKKTSMLLSCRVVGNKIIYLHHVLKVAVSS